MLVQLGPSPQARTSGGALGARRSSGRSTIFLYLEVAFFQVGLSPGRSLGREWRRGPGRPRSRWVDHFRRGVTTTPANLWRQATFRGHGRATLLYVTTTTTTRWLILLRQLR